MLNAIGGCTSVWFLRVKFKWFRGHLKVKRKTFALTVTGEFFIEEEYFAMK